jgi:hypothetical protein
MSGHISGQARALPFTGLMSALLVIIGLIVGGAALVMRQLRPTTEA